MLLVHKNLILPLAVFLDFHLYYLLFGTILLVLESQHPEEELALENTNKNKNLFNNYVIKTNFKIFYKVSFFL